MFSDNEGFLKYFFLIIGRIGFVVVLREVFFFDFFDNFNVFLKFMKKIFYNYFF